MLTTVTKLDFTQLSPYPSIQAISPDAIGGYVLIDAPGKDAANFLQGQLTADLASLPVGLCVPAALCNPQGRVIAQCDVLHRDKDHFQLALPAALADVVISTLSRYVLRAKVSLTQLAEPVSVCQRAGLEPGQIAVTENECSWRPRWNNEADWAFTTAPINSELPQITWQQAYWLWAQAPLVTERFLPQMLNLDALGAVHFQKGCYTGQEVIARVHFRGSVKRRLRRFLAHQTDGIDTAASITTRSGKNAGEIVSTCHDDCGHTGILAVMRAAHWDDTGDYVLGDVPLTPVALPYPIEE